MGQTVATRSPDASAQSESPSGSGINAEKFGTFSGQVTDNPASTVETVSTNPPATTAPVTTARQSSIPSSRAPVAQGNVAAGMSTPVSSTAAERIDQEWFASMFADMQKQFTNKSKRIEVGYGCWE